MSAAALVLRDIHAPPPPPFWPPAPGWWLVLAGLVLIAGLIGWWRWRRYRRRCRVLAAFDAALTAADTPAGQVAALSGLLRRAARLRWPHTATLPTAAWREWLAGQPVPSAPPLDAAQLALLVDGGFRPEVASADAAALVGPVRARVLAWTLAALP